jgi:hypothetical protein
MNSLKSPNGFHAQLRKSLNDLLSERRANAFYGALTAITLLLSACVTGGEEPSRAESSFAAQSSQEGRRVADSSVEGPRGRSASESVEAFRSPYQPSSEEYRAMGVADQVETF